MHAHVVLMLAATALVGLFVVIVVAVTALDRRGRLGARDRTMPFKTYGPILAAACSAGAAVVHVGVVGEHAALSAAAGSPDAVAFLCSIGAGTTHFAAADPALAPFLPIGVLSLGTIGAQGALAIPRFWQHRRVRFFGLAITVAALAIAAVTRVVSAGLVGTAGTSQVVYSDALAIVFDITLLVVVALLVAGRPRFLARRLTVSVIDAWVGTGLGVAAVAVFTVAGWFLAHAAH